jgi:hypothetical protein
MILYNNGCVVANTSPTKTKRLSEHGAPVMHGAAAEHKQLKPEPGFAALQIGSEHIAVPASEAKQWEDKFRQVEDRNRNGIGTPLSNPPFSPPLYQDKHCILYPDRLVVTW